MSHQQAPRRVTTDLGAVDDSDCTVLHVDMDAFFAAVELQRHPDLRDRPMMVAGTGGRGVVLSATYEARAYGVRSAMPTAQALARCPGIAVIPPDHTAYRTASAAVMAVLRSVTPAVEQVSVDEAFLDVAGSRRTGGTPGEIAVAIRRRIADETGLTATVGAASTKFAAKLASTLAKPDGLLLIPPADVAGILHPLPVGVLWGVGPKTAVRLQSLGLTTVGDIAGTDPGALAAILGPRIAHGLVDLAHGRDDRAVTPHTAEASIGAERTFTTDLTDAAEIQRALLDLARTAAHRVRRAGKAGRTVVVKVRFDDFTTVTRNETMAAPVNGDRETHAAAIRSWSRLDAGHRPVRLLGVRLEGLVPAGSVVRQLELGSDPDRPGWTEAQTAIDALADRFGAAAPRPATLFQAGPRRPRGAAADRSDAAGDPANGPTVER